MKKSGSVNPGTGDRDPDFWITVTALIGYPAFVSLALEVVNIE